MSKNINVNPDHYKVAGRERQGEDVNVTEQKQKFVSVQTDLAARADQRNRSIESMRQRVAKPASPKKAKTKSPASGDEAGEAGATGRKAPAPGPRGAATAGAKKVGSAKVVKKASRKAARTAKKTRRATAKAGSAVATAARTAAKKAKKAVKPRPKQALPKRPRPAGNREEPKKQGGIAKRLARALPARKK